MIEDNDHICIPGSHLERQEIEGKKIRAVSIEECNKADWWVCRRISDGPPAEPKFKVDKCTRCDEHVWFDPNIGINKPPKICIQCMINTVQYEKVVEE